MDRVSDQLFCMAGSIAFCRIEVHQPFDHHQPAGLELPQGNFAQVLAMPEAHGANTLSATRTGAPGRAPMARFASTLLER